LVAATTARARRAFPLDVADQSAATGKPSIFADQTAARLHPLVNCVLWCGLVAEQNVESSQHLDKNLLGDGEETRPEAIPPALDDAPAARDRLADRG
jgi:hypothetical protein